MNTRYVKPKLDQRITLLADAELVGQLDALTVKYRSTRSDVLRRLVVDAFTKEKLDPANQLTPSQRGRQVLDEQERQRKWAQPSNEGSYYTRPDRWVIITRDGRFRWEHQGNPRYEISYAYERDDLMACRANLEAWEAANPHPFTKYGRPDTAPPEPVPALTPADIYGDLDEETLAWLTAPEPN